MKVLVAVDDSKFSEAAVRALGAQIRPQMAEVQILHVLQPIAVSTPPQMAANYAPELEDQGKRAKELVERSANTLRAAGLKVETRVEKGDVRLRIVDLAAEWNADLVVIGSHGRTGIPRLLLGSVADYVARNAPCSVEIVRTPNKKQ
jgi:nucleotide-binding universal stress UspA family protein